MRRVRSYIQKTSFTAIAFVVMVTACASGFMAASANTASALSGSDFNAGRIIDDVVFTNYQAMSVSDIQNFLNAKVPSCDTSGSQDSSHWNSGAGRYYTRAEWGSLKGYPAPYTCLKSYYENTSTFANNAADPGSSVPGGLSAAQIIYNAAQAYRINPQVILTTLQKEQGLITDDWPWENQYNYAMGYGCPDSSGCSTTYRGFFKQVDNAAWQFRYYIDHPYAYNYWIGNYYVQYNPNSSCGGSVINIQNAATAALYIYTPYQPNAASLNNLNGGSADSCSSYGNRNFWYYFTTWFGSTQAASYSYQVLDQYVYSDQTKTHGTNLVNKLPGDRVYVGIKVRNTGNRTWSNTGSHPVNVGTEWPSDRNSKWCDSSWLGCNRPARLIESSVAPGATGTFEFWMKASNNPGSYKEYFNLVVEGAAWMPATGLYFPGSIQPYRYTWEPVDQYAYSDATKTHGTNTVNKMPGDRVYVGIKAKNTGNVTWSKSGANTIQLGTAGGYDRNSAFYDSSWINSHRPAELVEDSVAPGQVGTFEFWMKASNNPGSYLEYFSPYIVGVGWLNNPGLNFRSSILQPNYSWQLVDQYAYSDATKTTGKGTTNLNPGDTVYVGFKAKNTGNVTWKNDGPYPVNVGMTHPLDRNSAFFYSGWLGANRPARLIESSVAPGQVGTFEFTMKAPSQSGVYREYFSLVAEGIAWMNDPNMNFYMSVK
ncbi:MAG TPA: NBR1-Ig-like domain-containing protein [Candidatus Saccharimonadales bacterium]|nr:NBR1-Ig-like domain-containing protein [Candidatus Saccharimonadales bacterium]